MLYAMKYYVAAVAEPFSVVKRYAPCDGLGRITSNKHSYDEAALAQEDATQ